MRRTPRPGRYPVLFDRRVSSSLLGHFAGAISGAAIARKTSFLRDRLHQQVFAPGVFIIDDPLRARGLRSRPFDGEGVRVARQQLGIDREPVEPAAQRALPRRPERHWRAAPAGSGAKNGVET